MGSPGTATDEVADHTLALLLALTRGIAESSTAFADGGWKAATDFASLISLRGQSMGILGLGRIGQAVARRAAAFGLRVGAYDPGLKPEEILRVGVEPLEITDVLSREIVSLHLPLTAETRHLVDHSLLQRMPEEAILLNVSRGGLIKESDLLKGLDSGRPMFAGLDVLEEEPPSPNHPLLTHPRVIVTPHIGYYSSSSLINLRRQVAETVVRSLRPEAKKVAG